MKKLYYTIDDRIFKQFPGYARGIVMAYRVSNGRSSAKLAPLLRAAEASVCRRLNMEDIIEHPRIDSWRKAYYSFGAKPSKYRSSIEAMTRRVLRNQEIPSINTFVDIGNIISLSHLVPIGVHALDVVTQDIYLRPATGKEVFMPFGSDQIEHPLPGEVIFVEGKIVLTRRWTWRQANHTLTLPTTKAIGFNVDALPPVPISEVEKICREIIMLVEQYSGGSTHYEYLTRKNPRIKLTM